MSFKFTKCRTKFCRGRACSKLYHSPFCSRCRSKRWRAKHPITAAYHDLKYRAKQRGHAFTITLEYFIWFCASTDYIERKGKTATSLSIDRINNDRGYEPGNLQVLTLSEKSRKQFVPFWKDQAEKERLIAESEAKVKEAYAL